MGQAMGQAAWIYHYGAHIGSLMLWEQLKASPATEKKGTKAKAMKGAAIDGETNGRGSSKAEGMSAPKALWDLLRLCFPLALDGKFGQCSQIPPRCPLCWGYMRNNPRKRSTNIHGYHSHASQHHSNLCIHTAPSSRSLSMEGQLDNNPLGLLRGPMRWRSRSRDPHGTYLQTFLPSGSSSCAELCTHSHR